MARIRIVQVGVGGMGDVWLRTVLQSSNVELAALVDVSETTLQNQTARYSLTSTPRYTSLQTALEQVDADGLINVTPPQFHEEVCCSAFKAGLPVLTEKPLADTLQAAKRTVDCAERAGVVFMVAQNYRYQPVIGSLRQIVNSERYGRPGQVQVSFHKGPHFGGFREQMDFPLIIDMSIHHFDMMRHILGENPVNVSGRSWNPTWSWFRGDASTALTFEFTGGVHVTYHGSWCSTGAETPWNANWRIECDHGVVLLQDDVVYKAPTGEPLQVVKPDEGQLSGQVYLLDEFYRAIAEGIVPVTHSRDNLHSLAMVFGSVRAVQAGEVVQL